MKRLSFENIDLSEFDKTAEKEKLNWENNEQIPIQNFYDQEDIQDINQIN